MLVYAEKNYQLEVEVALLALFHVTISMFVKFDVL